MGCLRTFVLLASCGLALTPAWAEDLASALQALPQQHPAWQSLQAEVTRAEAAVRQARGELLPTLTGQAGFSWQNQDGERTQPLNYGLTLDQPLYQGGALRANLARAEAEAQATLAQQRQQQQDLLQQAIQAYLEVLTAASVAEAATQQVTALTQHARQTRLRFELGDVTITDVQQAEARLAAAQAQAAAASSRQAAATASYQEQFNQTPGALQWPALDLVLPATPPSAATLTAHPAWQAAQARLNSAQQQVRQARAGHLPTLQGQASVQQYTDSQRGPGQAPDYDESRLGLQLRVPLYNGGQVRAQVQQAVASQTIAQLGVETISRQLLAQASTRYHQLQAAQVQYEARQTQVAAAERSLQGVTEENKSGNRTVLDVLDAEQELLDAQMALFEARQAWLNAQIAWQAAQGTLTLEALLALLNTPPAKPAVSPETDA